MNYECSNYRKKRQVVHIFYGKSPPLKLCIHCTMALKADMGKEGGYEKEISLLDADVKNHLEGKIKC